MPSDDEMVSRVQRAFDALAERRAGFCTTVETAYAQARGFLAAHGPRSDDRARETALELGAFAGGRVDASRFAALVTASRVLSPDEETVVRRCAEVMYEVLAHGDGLYACAVPPGGDLHAAVQEDLAEAGRAFGAAMVFQAVCAGSYHADQHAPALRAFPHRRWSRGERLLAPPLIVSVDGADLHAGALAEFLDGQQKFVVIVRGTTTPAPLARLIAPRTFVAQLADVDVQAAADAPAAGALARAVAFDGPAVVALVPESAARFVHDPGAGATLAKRLTVIAMPKDAPRSAVGGHSVAQQREELAQLVELSALGARRSADIGQDERDERDDSTATSSSSCASCRTAESREPRAESVSAAGDSSVAVSALTSWLLAQAGFASSSTTAAAPTGTTTAEARP